jgi:signal transduction histidine kinase
MKSRSCSLSDTGVEQELVAFIDQLAISELVPPLLSIGGQLPEALNRLAVVKAAFTAQEQVLARITEHIAQGWLLDDCMAMMYDDLWSIIPYNRIGLAFIEDEGYTVRTRWARTDQPHLIIGRGYATPLASSSLRQIAQSGQPRIINDLEAYGRQSLSIPTRDALAEGVRSSLTCPLLIEGRTVGFLFFSSAQPDTYRTTHVDLFLRIANRISWAVEKARLTSEIAEQRAAIQQQNARLERFNELKNLFLGIAAHELRNPIGLIQLNAELLGDPETPLSPDERQRSLADIQRLTRHALSLLSDWLDVATIEAGELKLKLVPIEVGGFVREVVEQYSPLASNKGTTLFAETETGLVMADPLRLRQILENLISNAVKYSPVGSEVRIGARLVPEGWRFWVSDRGPGIKVEERERLFSDFGRLSSQPTGGEKSVGLGLSIVRRLVAAHGGRVGVESEPGNGSEFWFILPGNS